MRVSTHFVFSSILMAAFYPAFKWKAVFILAGGVLIDIDHYFWWVFKHKKLNIIEAYKFFDKSMETKDFTDVEGMLLIHHTIEFLLLCIALSFYSGFVLMFTIGVLLHYVLDLIWMYRVPKRLIANNSIIWWIVENRE